MLRLGTLEGRDAFGRIAHVALRNDGHLVVLDQHNRELSVYDVRGDLLRRAGRRGRGPGEFELPWHVAVGRGDSVLVWDLALGRMSVFSAGLAYVRSFPLPNAWNVNSIVELPSGEFLIAAYDPRTQNGLHVVSRTGVHRRSFARISVPPGVIRFHESVLGGYAVMQGSHIVYSLKSPYRLDVYDLEGRPIKSCVGSSEATTPPERVVEATPNGARLQWRRFVHTVAVLSSVVDGIVLNLIVDQEQGRSVLDAVELASCRLVGRSVIPSALYLDDSRNGMLAGALEGEIPAVVVYRLGRLVAP